MNSNLNFKLIFSLIFFGLGNKLFSIFQSKPMHNYPVVLNLWSLFIYTVISSCYVLPLLYFSDEISTEERRIPKKHFAIMGILDGISAMSSQFAINYIYKSSLVPLLQQSSLPFSMISSYFIVTGTKFHKYNFIGAFIVLIGLFVILIPGVVLEDNSDKTDEHGKSPIFWCIVLVLGCIPSVVSSAYKEEFLNFQPMNVNIMYVNFWISIFQLVSMSPIIFFSPLLSGGGTISSNVSGGFKCLFGINTVRSDSNNDSLNVFLDDDCSSSLVYVNLFLFFNFIFNIYLMIVLKKESNAVLWLSLTLIVPLTQIILWIPGVPGHSIPSVFDVFGLIIIITGLFIYHFVNRIEFNYADSSVITRIPPDNDEERLTLDSNIYTDHGSIYDALFSDNLIIRNS